MVIREKNYEKVMKEKKINTEKSDENVYRTFYDNYKISPWKFQKKY